MKRLSLAMISLLSVSSALAEVPSIIEVTPGVTVAFPGEPERQTEPNTGGDIYKFQGASDGERYAFVAIGMTAPHELSEIDAAEAFDGVAESYERRGKIIRNERARYQSHAAARIEAVLDNGQRIRALSVVNGSTVNTLNWITAAESPLPDAVGDSFFDSLNVNGKNSPPKATESNAHAAASPRAPQTLELDPREIGRTVGKAVAIMMVIALIVVACIFFAIRRRRPAQSK